MLNAAHDQR